MKICKLQSFKGFANAAVELVRHPRDLKSPRDQQPKRRIEKTILEKSGGKKYANSSENPVKAVCSRAEPERV